MNILQKFRLQKTLKKLNTIYNTINYGGCGYFAKELGNVLKTKGYEVKYVLLLSNEDEVDYANKCINKNKINILNGLSWAHVMVNVEDKLIDVEGLFDVKYDEKKKVYLRTKGYSKYYGITLPETLLHTWLTPQYDKNWNPTFDRKIVPKMRKELQKSLVG